MQFSESLKKNRDFQLTYKKEILCKQISCHVCQREWYLGQQTGTFSQQKGREQCSPSQGYTAMRESYRLQEEHFRRGYDIIIIARASAKDKSYQEIESAVVHLGKLHHIYLQDTQQDSSDKGNEMEMKR